jgi:hypothetical protein
VCIENYNIHQNYSQYAEDGSNKLGRYAIRSKARGEFNEHSSPAAEDNGSGFRNLTLDDLATEATLAHLESSSNLNILKDIETDISSLTQDPTGSDKSYIIVDRDKKSSKKLHTHDASSILGSDRRKRTDKYGIIPDIGPYMNVMIGKMIFTRSA